MNEQIIFDKIREVDWQNLINRKETLLFFTLVDGSYAFFKDATGIPWKPKYVIRGFSGDIYYDHPSLARLSELFTQGGLPLLQKYYNRMVKSYETLDSLTKKIEKTDWKNKNQKELLKAYTSFVHAAKHSANFLTSLNIADRVLSSFLIDALPHTTPEQKQQWLSELVFSRHENDYLKEQRSFYQLVQAYKKKDFNKKLKKHLIQFAWIGSRGYWFNRTWTEKDILIRIKSFLEQHKDSRKESSALQDLKKNQLKTYQLRIQQLKPSLKLLWLIRLAQDFAYRRTWRTDIYYHAGYRLRFLLHEIARQAQVTLPDITYLSYREVFNLIKNQTLPILPQELQQRKKAFCSLLLEDQPYILSGAENQQKLEKILGVSPTMTTELRGAIACKGIAIGKVVLVNGYSDIAKVKKGNILVTIMTFPNYIAAMEKASAFVTDEGGILCHAAIVAREMHKPCIIGTKNATKVLKDGMTVEVNADKGVVRILKGHNRNT